ncbi:MAG: putative Ig domain-containing protein [Acidobacteriia bacterium]|nr:putative Ig domain-containing protein [Terriglobia bacterium]
MPTLAQSPVIYLRSGGPQSGQIIGFDSTNGIQTAWPHGLSTGDIITAWGVCSGSTATNHVSNATGSHKITVVDATHFTLGDPVTNAPVTPNGTFCDGSLSWEGGGLNAGEFGHALPYTIGYDNPRGMFAGYNDPAMRALSTGTHNGLLSLIEGTNSLTVTLSYDPGLPIGAKYAIWGTTSNPLNRHNTSSDGTSYTISGLGTGSGTWTLTMATAGVSPGEYTHNDACGFNGVTTLGGNSIGGTENCVRVSSRAYIGNPVWDHMKTSDSLAVWPAYKDYLEGGTDFLRISQASQLSVGFLVDRRNANYAGLMRYVLNHPEYVSRSAPWYNRIYAYGGFLNMVETGLYGIMEAWTWIYDAARDFLTSGERTVFVDKMLNDNEDGCFAMDPYNADNRAGVYNGQDVLDNGTVAAGDLTHVTLGSSASATDNFYVNNIVDTAPAWSTRADSFGLITAYNGTTKVATVTGWTNSAGSASTPAATGMVYKVLATITVSSKAKSTPVIVTGYNTHFASYLSAGDYIIGSNGFQEQVEALGSRIISVDSDTQLHVYNDSQTWASITVPQAVAYIKQWSDSAKSCGYVWSHKLSGTTMMGNSTSYPATGGGNALAPNQATYSLCCGSNNKYSTHMAEMELNLALLGDDPVRAGRNLAMSSASGIDQQIRWALQYNTGFTADGAGYGVSRTLPNVIQLAWLWGKLIPGYPSIDLTGPWMKGTTMFKMYDALADRRNDYLGFQNWGNQSNGFNGEPGLPVMGSDGPSVQQDASMMFAPTSAEAQRYKDFLIKTGSVGAPYDTYTPEELTQIDPNITRLDYTLQPHQYLFQATSAATCASLTGWPCPANFNAQGVISHTGWQDTPNSTHLLYRSFSYYSGNHDYPSPGLWELYKVGELTTSDMVPAGESSWHPAELANAIGFGPTGVSWETLFKGTGAARGVNPIVRWWSGNHGAWNTAFGDQDSKVAYWMSDLTSAYKNSYTRVHRHMAHMKGAGEEIIVQYDDADAGSSVTGGIYTHTHFANNGGSGFRVSYTEGATICPGSSGCGGLNADRIMLSQESGAPADSIGPARTNGLVWKVFSPGTITARYDGTGSAGNANYPIDTGGNTIRVSLCAGSSCGASAQTFEAVQVFKVTNSLADTTLTATQLGDANWTGVQTTDKVVLFARKGVTPTSASFTTTHSGTAQYLVAGLTSGYYDVYNGATKVVSNAAVAPGDNALEFENVAGGYTIEAAGSVAITTTSPLPQGLVSTSYAQTFAVAGGTPAYTWSITAGSLPAGLSLNASTGAITGTPTTAATSSFTVNVVDSLGVGASRDFTLSIYSVLAITSGPTLPQGAPGVPYSQVLGATGGDGAYTWTLTSGSLPSGLTLASNGTVSGTPTGAELQTPTFHVTSGDGQGASKAFTIRIAIPVNITTNSPLPTGWIGTVYSQTLAGSGGTSPYTWSVISGLLPGGLSLSTGGALTGTPSAAGTFTFTAQATDTLSGAASKQFSLTIYGILTVTSTSPLPSGIAGVSYSQNLAATGGDGSYTWSLLSGALPSGMTLATNGAITGTPTQLGVSAVTIQVSSGDSQTASSGFSITTLAPSAAVKGGGLVRAGSVIH